jgi:hypothetical protein
MPENETATPAAEAKQEAAQTCPAPLRVAAQRHLFAPAKRLRYFFL